MKSFRGKIFEVGLRDGLQSEARHFSLDEKEKILKSLIESGLEDIEVGSFVRADKIPQLKDSAEVLKRAKEIRAQIKSKTKFWVFVPNLKGFELASEAGPDGMSFFYSTSESFCKKNVNRGQIELLLELKTLLAMAKKAKIKSRVYLSTLVYCPYEGKIPEKKVFKAVKELFDIGAQEVALSDTTGHATPLQVRALLKVLLKKHSASKIALHLHDTRGLALANVWEAMQFGISRFDSSVAGLGGCPYAPGAAGNLSTEDLWNFLTETTKEKAPYIENIVEAALFTEKCLGRKSTSKVLRSLESKYVSNIT
ncbi:MAG: hydroxymethylglutaryl-CoA lyase [Proteobacteria bacterium]|nr:hydroxymethylglutaryl-CoA lyase [Pseudomonadota bacterium]